MEIQSVEDRPSLRLFDMLLEEMCGSRIPITRNYSYDKPDRTDEKLRDVSRFLKREGGLFLRATLVYGQDHHSVYGILDKIDSLAFEHSGHIRLHRREFGYMRFYPRSLLVKWSDLREESCIAVKTDKSDKLYKWSKKMRKKNSKRGYEFLYEQNGIVVSPDGVDAGAASNRLVNVTKKGALILIYPYGSRYEEASERRILFDGRLRQ